MAQGLNTGINVGQAQVLEPYHVKGQGESPFAYIAKKRDAEAERKKAQEDFYKKAALHDKFGSMNGVHENDIETLNKMAGEYHAMIAKNAQEGTLSQNWGDLQRIEQGLTSAIEMSKRGLEAQKRGEELQKKYEGNPLMEEYNRDAYDSLTKGYNVADYGLNNLPQWLADKQKVVNNFNANYSFMPMFNEAQYQKDKMTFAKEYAATHASKDSTYDPQTGLITSTGGVTYNPTEMLSLEYDKSLPAQRYYSNQIAKSPALQKEFANSPDPAKALFIKVNKPYADVATYNKDIKGTSKGSKTNASASAGGGGGWVEDDITFVPNKISSELVADKIRDAYNADVGSGDEENKKKDPNFVSKTVTDISQIPGVNQADVNAIKSGKIKQVTFSKKGEKPLNLKIGNGEEEIPMAELSIAKFGNKYYIIGSQVLGVNSDGVTFKLGNQVAVPYEQNKGDVESTIKGKNLVDIYEEVYGGKKRQKATSSTTSTNTGNKGTVAPKKEAKMSFVEWKKKNPNGTAAQYKEYHKQ